MPKTHIRIAMVLAGVVAVSTVFAAGVPSNVTAVQAKVENGKLIVEWQPATDEAGIASYRIYYSRKSILDNEGDYDDFEQTSDEQPRFEFARMPFTGQKIFVSVLAVNTSGIESEAFETEAEVDLPSQETVTQPTESSEPAATQPEAAEPPPQNPMTLENVEVPDSTTVILTFSEALAEGLQLGPGFFIIVDEGGGILDVREYAKDGAKVTLKTSEQIAGRRYVIGVLQRIFSEDGSSIDGSAPQTQFVGSEKASEQPVAPPQSSSSAPADTYGRNPNIPGPGAGSQSFLDLLRNRNQQGSVLPQQPQQSGQFRDTVPPENPSGLRLSPVLRSDGTYNVTADWRGSPDTARDLQGYAVATTQDGRTFTPNSTTDADQTSTRYTRVSPGRFGVRVSAFDQAGNRSAGVDKVITLPQSGLGFLGIALISGVAAMRQVRRKRQA